MEPLTFGAEVRGSHSVHKLTATVSERRERSTEPGQLHIDSPDTERLKDRVRYEPMPRLIVVTVEPERKQG
jgi:hypothetical protein